VVLLLGMVLPAAAVPASPAFAFATWRGGLVVIYPGGSITPSPPGRYKVLFKGMAGPRGIVHVTAIHRAGNFCQAEGWAPNGSDELVQVNCYTTTGTPADTDFEVMYVRAPAPFAPPGEYALMDSNNTGTLNDAFNSTGGVVNSTPSGTGQWVVTLGNVGAPFPAGNLQVTAVDKLPTHCKVADWAFSAPNLKVLVRCTDANGNPQPSRFTLSYHRERSIFAATTPWYGYMTVWQPGIPTDNYTAGQTNFNSTLGFNANSSVGVTPYQVKMPTLYTKLDDAQVTAFGAQDPNYCTLADMTRPVGADMTTMVLCFKPLSTSPTNSGYFIGYAALH